MVNENYLYLRGKPLGGIVGNKVTEFVKILKKFMINVLNSFQIFKIFFYWLQIFPKIFHYIICVKKIATCQFIWFENAA